MGKDLIIKLLAKIDPKWIPAIISGVGLILTVIYLVYTKKKLEDERKELRIKLAVAHAKATDRGIKTSQEESLRIAKEASDLQKEIKAQEASIKKLQEASRSARVKVAKAVSWKDLDL